MPLYGSLDAVKAMLRADVGSTFNADADTRLTAIRKAVSAWIEGETGRTFGTGSTSETIAVRTPGNRPVLLLPKAVRTITSVTISPEWNGSAWTGGTALAADDYVRDQVTRLGEALALRRTDYGWWPTVVVIVGTWADTDADATVPDDITYAANYLISERFKLEQASPAGQIGPDGSVIPVRNSLKDPLVSATMDYWRVQTPVIV